jgi:hypothetical protein
MSVNLASHASAQGFGTANLRINSESQHVDWHFQPKEPVTITHLGFLISSISGIPPVYRIALKEVGTNGEPGAVLVSKFITPDSSMVGKFTWFQLPITFKARRGEWLCISLQHYSGYISNTNCITVTVILEDRDASGMYPYCYGIQTYAGSTWGRGLRCSDQGIFGYKSTSRAYGFPIKSLGNVSSNYPSEIGLRIFLGSGFGTTYKLLGSIFEAHLSTYSGQTFTMTLYDYFNTVLNRITWDSNHSAYSTSSGRPTKLYFDDAILATLAFGKEYFLAFAAGQADSNFNIMTLEVEENFDLTAFPGSSNFYLVQREDPSAAWTRVRTKRPQIDLVVDDWSS